MQSLVDMHVHLLAGLDDGPKDMDSAVAMARIAYAEGVRATVALAHQNPEWPDVTPTKIREATVSFRQALLDANIEMEVFPSSEIMAEPLLVESWQAGSLMSVADRGEWILLEMPHETCVDLRPIIHDLGKLGVRVILAHAERTRQWLLESGMIEQLISMGCLVQVSASSITHPRNPQEGKALRSWIERGIVHLLGSDGHSVHRRPPKLANAARQISQWLDPIRAARICCENGMAILKGQPLRVPPPTPLQRRSWFSSWW